VNKKFTYMTMASGNYHVLPGGTDDYEWELIGDADTDFRITELLVDPNAQHGKGNLPFKIAFGNDWVHEPAILMTEDPNAPLLRIIGYPEPLSATSWAYEVELQTGDPTDWIPTSLISPDRILTRNTSAVSDELNQKYASDQFGSMTKLRSWCGQFANKIEFTDKFVRTEIACAKGKQSGMGGQSYSFGGKKRKDAVSNGYIYQQSLFDKKSKKKIQKGVFITIADARLLERTEKDRENMMEFGRLQKTEDRDTSRPIKIAPGWRQLVRDGHYWEHNGSLTLGDLSEFVTSIFFRRRNFTSRKIYLYTGEGGIELLSRLIAQEASLFNYPDANFFVRKNPDPMGVHSNELEFGAQFTRVKFFNGVDVCIAYDPIKDDDKLFKIKAPGSNRPIESYAIDIFDLGHSESKAENAGDANMTMVLQDGVEEYYHVCNVYNFKTGAITNGGNSNSNNKELGIYRCLSGSLAIWDVSRVGRIEYNPYM